MSSPDDIFRMSSSGTHAEKATGILTKPPVEAVEDMSAFPAPYQSNEVKESLMSNMEYGSALREVIRTVRALKGGDLSARASVAGISGEWAELVTELDAALDATAANMKAGQCGRQALDHLSGSVMIADTDGKIFYANRSVLEMLAAAESDLRKDLPNFSVSRILGANIDVFHRDPRHQRRILDGLLSTHRTQISVGGRQFSLVASPLFDNSGKKVAVSVEWLDRTADLRIEKDFVAAIDAAGRGDFSRKVELSGAAGVVKLLGEAINRLFEINGSCLAKVSASLNRIANGDLTKGADVNLEGAFGALYGDAEQVRSNL